MKTVTMAVGFSFVFGLSPCLAEITTDNSFGAGHTVFHSPGTHDFIIGQELGSLHGHNLFHSFGHFNLTPSETAIFTGNNRIQNVISRVTGGESAINGTIKSTIGHAAFYFINPNGIVFGEGAKVDVPGAFHVSTAAELKLAGGGRFNAVHPKASIISVASPEAFGFLGGTRQAQVSLTIKGRVDGDPTLFVSHKSNLWDTKKISFTAGTLNFNNIVINSNGGDINLRAVGNNTVNANIVNNKGTTWRDTTYNGNLTINDSSISTDGNGGGLIIAQAGNMTINDSFNGNTLTARNTSNKNSNSEQGIRIGTANTLTMIHNGRINTSTSADGKGGQIIVDTGKIYIDGQGSGIVSLAGCSDGICNGKGNAGNITVKAQDTIQINRSGIIQSSSYSKKTGNAGTVDITANHIIIDGSHKKNTNDDNTGIFSDTCSNSNACSRGNGNAGNVIVHAGTLKITNNGTISNATYNHGKGGDININIKVLDVSHGGLIDSSTYAGGNAGNIKVTADKVIINGVNNYIQDTKINSNSSSEHCSNQAGCNGNAGTITINADKLTMQHNAKIETVANNVDGGAVNLNNRITRLDNSQITTSVTGNGNGGNINITGKALVLNGGFIQANTTGKNNKGGNISINIDTLLASRDQLILGGTKQTFKSGSGINLIQAVNDLSSPKKFATQLNITSTMLNLKSNVIPIPDLNATPCNTGKGSSLVQRGYGGIPQTPSDGVYIPRHKVTTAKQSSLQHSINAVSSENDSTCTQ